MFDIRSILKFPRAYRLLQRLTGAERHNREYVVRYARPKAGDAVLDIGCGPAEILDFLPAVKYYGFDPSQQYIAEAKKKYGERGVFFCEKLSLASAPAGVSFDLVLANKVLHHLNDDEAIELFRLAAKCLKPGGRLVTSDGCRSADDGFVVRWLAGLDRGKYLRDKEGYLKLVNQGFSRVEYDIRNDLLVIPGSLIFITCTR